MRGADARTKINESFLSHWLESMVIIINVIIIKIIIIIIIVVHICKVSAIYASY